MSWLDALWRPHGLELQEQQRDVLADYAQQILRLRQDVARLREDLCLADECKDEARRERDAARASLSAIRRLVAQERSSESDHCGPQSTMESEQ